MPPTKMVKTGKWCRWHHWTTLYESNEPTNIYGQVYESSWVSHVWTHQARGTSPLNSFWAIGHVSQWWPRASHAAINHPQWKTNHSRGLSYTYELLTSRFWVRTNHFFRHFFVIFLSLLCVVLLSFCHFFVIWVCHFLVIFLSFGVVIFSSFSYHLGLSFSVTCCFVSKWHKNDEKMTKWRTNGENITKKWRNDTKMTKKWRNNDKKMTKKWRKNDEKMTKWRENDETMTKKWRKNDEKMTKWRKNDEKKHEKMTKKSRKHDEMTKQWRKNTKKWRNI